MIRLDRCPRAFDGSSTYPRRRRRRICRLQSRAAAARRRRRASSSSSTICCRPTSAMCRTHPAVEFVLGSITDDRVLRGAAGRPRLRLSPRLLPRQPVVDPRPAGRSREQHADLAEAVRAAEGHSVAAEGRLCRGRLRGGGKDLRRGHRHHRGRAGLAVPRQPVFDLEADRRDVRQLLFPAPRLPFVKARFQNVYGPGEILGAGRWRGTLHTVWRNVTPTFIWKALHGEALPVENGGIARRDFIFVEDIARGLMACALQRRARRSLQSRLRGRDNDPRTRRADQRADRQPDADRACAGARLGPLGPALRRPDQSTRAARLRRRDVACATASPQTIAWTRANRDMISALHAAARALCAGTARRYSA